VTSYYDDAVALTSDYFNHPLICPVCGNDNLHQQAVGVYHNPFDSRREDSQGFLVTPDGECVVHTRLHAGVLNPSDRRDGIRISFMCEHSCKVPDLLILQQKGTTYMGWDNEPSGSRLWPNET
jgi:hypothetical protein